MEMPFCGAWVLLWHFSALPTWPGDVRSLSKAGLATTRVESQRMTLSGPRRF